MVQANRFGLPTFSFFDDLRPRYHAILKALQKRPRGSLSPLEGRKIQTGAPSSVGPPHLSPVPDWLGAIARPMMCRHWAPGARQPGRTAVRSPDMTLNGRRWGEFRRGQCSCPWIVGLLSLNGDHDGDSHTTQALVAK